MQAYTLKELFLLQEAAGLLVEALPVSHHFAFVTANSGCQQALTGRLPMDREKVRCTRPAALNACDDCELGIA